jgi:hypothetical protein
MAPWNKVAMRTLPSVWRKTHVIKIEYSMVNSTNAIKGNPYCGVPGTRKVGRCHSPHNTPKIKLAVRADRFSSSRGKA